MKIIEVAALSNGAHRNQTIDAAIDIPEGWAVIPDDMETENFPFGEVVAENVDGVMSVAKWIPGEMPEPIPVEVKLSQLDIIEAQVTYTAMMTDTLLEG